MGLLSFFVTALVHGIPHVIHLRAEEQVSRIAAARLVATMQGPQAVRNGPVCQFPRVAVGRNLFPGFELLASPIELSVAEGRTGTHPQPAFVGPAPLHLLPEALRLISLDEGVLALSGAEVGATDVDAGAAIGSAASLADQFVVGLELSLTLTRLRTEAAEALAVLPRADRKDAAANLASVFDARR